MAVISKMTFDNGSTKNLIGSTFYGKCSQTGDVAAKTVTIGGWSESTKDNVSGTTIHVLFSNGNTAANPTLNVDNQGAHPIYIEEDVKASSFPAGIYALTLTQLIVSSQETWCWLMDAKAVSAASVPWSGVTNPPATYTPTSHTHGNISNAGAITSTVTIASGDKLLIADSSDSTTGKLAASSISFGSDSGKYLSNSGTWEDNAFMWVPDGTGQDTDGMYYYSTSISYSDVLASNLAGKSMGIIASTNAVLRIMGSIEETASLHGDTGNYVYWLCSTVGTEYASAVVFIGDYNDPINQTGSRFYIYTMSKEVDIEFPGELPNPSSTDIQYVLNVNSGGSGSWSTINIPITKPSQDGTYSLQVSSGTPSWTAVAPSGLQPPSANGHYLLGVNGSAVTWEDTTLTVAIASGDKLLIADSSDGNKIKSATATFGSSTNTYLKNDGTWSQPSLNEISGTDDLQAIEGLTGNSGLLKKTASNTWALDTTTYSTLTLGETSSTAYRGDRGKTAYDHASETKSGQVTSGFYKFSVTSQGHIASTTVVTKSDITGLGIPGQDTTYVFDGTYNASTNKAATVKTVTDKIEALDKTVTGADPSKTLSSLSETDGIISATFTPISITKSQVSDFAHSHGNISNGGTITATASASTEDSIIMSDSSASGALVKGPTFGTSTSTYLRNDGTWATPSAGVTSVTIKGTSPVTISSEAAITTTGTRTISLATAYGDTQNPYGSKTANTVLAAPNGSAGNPSFRALVAADIPSLTKSKISDFPTNVSAFTNDAGYVTTNTTYTLSTGDANGQIKVTPSVGDAYNVDVKGLGSNAYTSTSYLPTAGGNVTGDITLLKQVASGAPGDSYALIFQRGTLTDSYNDWMIVDSGGYLYFKERGSGSTAWTTRVNFNTSGGVIATGQVQGNSLASSSFLTLGSTATLASGDSLIFVDSSDSNRIKRGGPAFGTSTTTFLRNDGTWATPSVSGYIPTSEKGAASGVATLDTNSKVPIVQSNYLYGKCTTAGSTAAKTVTITGYDESTIANMEGVTVFIAFKNVSTASNPTLNVSGAGAHPIVTGTYDDPVAIGKFTNGLHAFTLVKALDNSYYWWINEGRDTVPEAPTSAGTYLLTINSSGNVSWSAYTPPTAATTGTLSLGATGWSGSGPYSHSVTISGTTASSKIDLQPDSTVLAQMTTDGTTALYIENNNGTLTAWAMGAAPTASLTIQYTKTEVG